jgi:hypothetical protein
LPAAASMSLEHRHAARQRPDLKAAARPEEEQPRRRSSLYGRVSAPDRTTTSSSFARHSRMAWPAEGLRRSAALSFRRHAIARRSRSPGIRPRNASGTRWSAEDGPPARLSARAVVVFPAPRSPMKIATCPAMRTAAACSTTLSIRTGSWKHHREVQCRS